MRGRAVSLPPVEMKVTAETAAWVEANEAYFGSMGADQITAVIAYWREAAAQKTGRDDIEFAAAFQRHYTKRGTGLPPNFAIAVTAAEVLAFTFNPRNAGHPTVVSDDQFKKQKATWPRSSVRFGETETGPLAYGMTLHVAGRDPVPCRAPKLPNNPAAAYAVATLGGELPVRS